MTRNPEVHELFAEWLSARERDAAEDPPRDLALHAAGCERCLRSASAVDTLSVIDVGAADAPPLRVVPLDDRGRLLRVARYAVAAAALVLVAGSVAVGSSWLGSIRPTDATAMRPTPGEGVLAGVPSATISPTPTQRPSASPSKRLSPSARASDPPTNEQVTPTFVAPVPTDQPPPPPPPTTAPTVAPSATPPPPTATPIPTSPPTATPTPPPTPTPTPDTDEDGVPDDVDQCPLEPAGPTPDPTRPGCPLPPLP